MDRRALVLFVAASVVFGAPYLFIKVAGEQLSPMAIAGARTGLAAVVLLVAARPRASWRTTREHPRAVALLAVLQFAVPFALIAWAEQHLPSSTTGLLIATEPLMIAVLALGLDPGERVGRRRLLGMLVGLVGVVLLLGVDLQGGRQELLAAGAVLLATASYSVAALMLPRARGSADVLPLTAAALGLSFVLLAPFAIFSLPAQRPTALTVAAILALAVVCTSVAFPLWFALIERAGAGRAALITYVNPVVAIALGVAVLGEPIGFGALTGLALILAGTRLGAGPDHDPAPISARLERGDTETAPPR